VCLILTAFLPLSLFADENGAAILVSNGSVLVNHSQAAASLALFPSDVIETQAGSSARIQLNGSTVDIGAQSVVEFHSDELVLDHGSVLVNTSHKFRVRVGCVLVTPAYEDWTLYDVTDTDGRVTVAAHRKDVYLNSHSPHAKLSREGEDEGRSHVTVLEGEQKSRQEKCGAADVRQYPAWDGPLDSPWVIGSGGGAILGMTLCILFCFDGNPVSPSWPNNKKKP